jgi:hypothetical protein
MTPEAALFIRIVFASAFFVILVAGIYLFSNYYKVLGIDPKMPSENASSRTYTKTLIFLVWIHALVLSAAFALMFH